MSIQFSRKNDYFYMVPFILLFAYCFFLEPLLYFTPINTITWQKYYDLNIVNFDIYKRYKNSRHSSGQNDIPWAIKLLNLFKIEIPKVNPAIFYSVPLRNFPHLSCKLRIRFIWATIIMNQFCKLLTCVVCRFH